MPNIPILRWGQPYESLELDTVVHFITGEPIAQVSQANSGLLQRDMRKARQARAGPLLESLREWLRHILGRVSKKSELAKAVSYILTRWTAFTRYRDDGCDISESCFTCPLPRCRYEEPGGLRSLLNEQRDRQIIQLRLKGVPVDALADHFGISRRTVFRVIGTIKQAPTPIPIRQEIVLQKEAHCA